MSKVIRTLARRGEALAGRVIPLRPVLTDMACRPYELHLELTNLCNANCVFCPYQFQTREIQTMDDRVFDKAVADFVRSGGGSVGLTPIVGDALIDPQFLPRVRRLRTLPEIDRIWLTTNAILLDKHGVQDILDSGLTSITISTAAFDQRTYERIYRSKAYHRVRRNVLDLCTLNAVRRHPVAITIALRADRPLEQVLADPDFQSILALKPSIDFTWSFTSAGGRITAELLPAAMKLRPLRPKRESCVQLFNGPIVLPAGDVLACSCVAAMDAIPDLLIGNVLDDDLCAIWSNTKMAALRASFGTSDLNNTCAKCDMYRNLELYRTGEGRTRARLNRLRAQGHVVRRVGKPDGSFSGG